MGYNTLPLENDILDISVGLLGVGNNGTVDSGNGDTRIKNRSRVINSQ